MEPDSQGANRQEQEHTQRVDGMTSAESVIARGPTSVSGYRPGQIIGGHYEVIELVGKGGMSLVYKTRHLLLNQLRAIKIILPQMDKDGRGLQRFQQEAKLASSLEHRNIVRTMEFASPSDGPPFLVMDFVEGRSLEQELSVLQRLSAERAVKIVLQIADALEYILSQGIIHRDLKPGNIILVKEKSHPVKGMPQDLVKLIDFGIARAITPDGDDSQGILYTPTGEVVGSPQHMSPEQCAGEALDERSEIYSLGCILYELLAGKPPIVGKNSLDTLRLQASVEARPLSKVVPDTAHIKELSRIAASCLEKDPEHRYQSIAALKEDLQAVLQKKSRKKSRSPLVPLIALLLTGSLATAGGYFWGRRSTGDEEPSISETAPVEKGPAARLDYILNWQHKMLSAQELLNAGDPAGESTLKEAEAMVKNLAKIEEDSVYYDAYAVTRDDLDALSFLKAIKDKGSTPPAKLPEAHGTRRIKHAQDLKKKLVERKKLDKETYQRLKTMLLEDDGYIPLTLQMEIFDRAYELCKDDPANELNATAKNLIGLMCALRRAEAGGSYIKGESNRLWTMKDDLQGLRKENNLDDLAWNYYYLGSFYASTEDYWDAYQCFEEAQKLFQKIYHEDDKRTLLARGMNCYSHFMLNQFDEGECRDLLRKCRRWHDRNEQDDRFAFFLCLARVGLASVNPEGNKEEKKKASRDGSRRETARRKLDSALALCQANSGRSNLYLARMLWLKEYLLKKLFSEKREPMVNYRLFALNYSMGNLPEAATAIEELADFYTSRFTLAVKLKLLNLADVLEEKLSASGHYRPVHRRDTKIALAEVLSDRLNPNWFNPKAALKFLEIALSDQQVVEEAEGEAPEDARVTRLKAKFFRAKILYLRALCRKELLQPSEAAQDLEKATAEIEANLKYLKVEVGAGKQTAAYKHDREMSESLNRSIKDLQHTLKAESQPLRELK